jgi:MFS family permease
VVALAAVLYGFGFGAYVPAMNALVGDLMPPSHRVRGFAMYFLAFDLALACGGVVVGPVADGYGRGVALGVAALTPVLAFVTVWVARKGFVAAAPTVAPVLPEAQAPAKP